jgi:hypothetical protein
MILCSKFLVQIELEAEGISAMDAWESANACIRKTVNAVYAAFWSVMQELHQI